jgi:hypothetical protein
MNGGDRFGRRRPRSGDEGQCIADGYLQKRGVHAVITCGCDAGGTFY